MAFNAMIDPSSRRLVGFLADAVAPDGSLQPNPHLQDPTWSGLTPVQLTEAQRASLTALAAQAAAQGQDLVLNADMTTTTTAHAPTARENARAAISAYKNAGSPTPAQLQAAVNGIASLLDIS